MILFISSKVLVLLFTHSERSIFTPTRRLTFLGFVLDSDSLCISPSLLTRLIPQWQLHSHTLKEFTNHWGGWEVAEVIGRMVPSFPELQFKLLYYCPSENEEIQALRENQEFFDNPMTFDRLLVKTLSGGLTISMIVINQSTGLYQTQS